MPTQPNNTYYIDLATTTANKENFPILNGLGMTRLTLDNGQLLVPHWHPNANELAYIVSGNGSVAVYGPGDVPPPKPFDVQTGTAVFFPQGFIHYIHNTGTDPLTFVLSFDNPNFDLLTAPDAFKNLPAAILADAYGVTPALITSDFQKGGTIVQT